MVLGTADIAFLPGRRDDLQDLDHALSDLFAVPVRTRELRRGLPAIAQAEEFSKTPEEPEVGVLVTAGAPSTGCLLLLLRPLDARRVGDLLGEGDAPQERLLDACREVGMIVAARYLAALERFAAPAGVPAPPVSTVDMQAAIVESTAALADASAKASLFEIRVEASAVPILMHLLVFV